MKTLTAAVCALALAIFAMPDLADAQGRGQGQGQGQGNEQGRGQGRGNDQDGNRGRGRDNGPQRGDRGHGRSGAHGELSVIIRDYYGGRRHSCARSLPPGIRRQVAQGRPIPPGLRRNRCRLPRDLVEHLPYRAGYEYYVVGTSVVHINVSSGIIVDIWVNLF